MRCKPIATGYRNYPPPDLASLPQRTCHPLRNYWCSRKESNLRPLPYQGSALPTELRERCNSGKAGLPARLSCSLGTGKTCARSPRATFVARVGPSLYQTPNFRGSGATFGAGEGDRTLISSLEGYSSTIELHPPRWKRKIRCGLLSGSGKTTTASPNDLPCSCHLRRKYWWREVDSNHRRHEPADLQSAPVGRLGIPPHRAAHCRGWPDRVSTERLGVC